MKYTNNKSSYHINGRTTWGRKNKVKFAFAGKVLSFTLFNQLLKENKKQINSDIIRINRFFGVEKAKELGYKSAGGDEFIEHMRITKTNAQKTLNAYKDTVSIELLDNDNDIDLEKIIKI